MKSYAKYQIRKESTKARIYPDTLFQTTEVMPLTSALNTLSRRKVVETGMRSLVRISNTTGAMI
jgi:hypothetical protein